MVWSELGSTVRGVGGVLLAGGLAATHPTIVGGALLIAGCDREIVRPGQLIVAIDTDMAMPEQVDQLHIRVKVRGEVEHQQVHDIGPGRNAKQLPGTLTIYADEPVRASVTIQVAGSKQTPDGLDWRTFREAIVTVPRDRIATLRMPVQWLCKGQAEAVPGEDASFAEPEAQSTCGEGFACRAGRCEPSSSEADDNLPDFAPKDIFGGGATPDEGSCFDTVACMARANAVEPDGDCRFEKPMSDDFNVALRVLNDGICDDSRVNCYVPLDGRTLEGWRIDDDRVQLPPAVCDRLSEGSVRAVLVSQDCAVKTPGIPACGSWSSVPKGAHGEYIPDGPVAPTPTVVARLPRGDEAESCCPLMAAGDKLYACVCSGSSNGTVFEIDPANDTEPRQVGSLNPPSTRTAPLAASVIDGALYWAAANEVRRTPLIGSNGLAGGLAVPRPSALYETGSLLADGDNVYVLASGSGGVDDASVQLFILPRDGASAPTSVAAGDVPVFQMDQDDAAVYLAVDRDEPTEGGIRRSSSVVRIDKQSRERTELMPELTLTVPSRERGGYVGVRVDDGVVYALFEAIDDDGTFRARVHALRSDGGREPDQLYDAPIDPQRTRLRLLGVAGGGVLLSRLELEDGRVVSSSLIALAAEGGAPRMLADFVRDFPVEGFGRDSRRIFWLNASGTLYGLARTALSR